MASAHVPWLDRAPLCPLNGESFTVSLQTYHDDLTAARIHVSAGGAWLPAAFAFTRGIYDVWQATLPASAPAGNFEYYFELTDGTATALPWPRRNVQHSTRNRLGDRLCHADPRAPGRLTDQ